MFRIYSRFEEGAFCEWHECHGCEPRFGPDQRELAVAWLRGFLVEDEQVAALRAAAHHAGVLRGLVGLSSQQVIDHLAWLISSGRVRVCGQGASLQESAIQEILREAGSAPSSAFEPVLPMRTPGRGRGSLPSGPEEGTLPGVDATTMADSLLAAAADGSPFCQVCDGAVARPSNTSKAPAETEATA